jgi:flagellar protein FliL
MARKPKEDKKAEAGDEAADGQTKKKKKRGLMVPAIIVAVGLLGGGYLMSQKTAKKTTASKDKSAALALPKGPILTIDPTTVNLADGHFLEVGLGLQVDNAKDLTAVTNDEALALNVAIAQFSKDTMAQLSPGLKRNAAQTVLAKQLARTFDKKVTAVYFTDFVMQ